MRKITFASILSICMTPMLFWSSESQAIPSWARKYEVSCYMCHSGMPQRNAIGEAFKNNGYRMPAGAEAAFTRQAQIKIGTEDWKKTIKAPISSSFPQFDPLSVVLSGNVLSYTAPTYTSKGAQATPVSFNYNVPGQVGLFFGGSVGDQLTIFGQISGFGGASIVDTDDDGSNKTVGFDSAAINANVRVAWEFNPGFNLALGNNFSNASWNGVGTGGVVNVSGVLPAPGTYAELNYTRGDVGGYSITAGTSMAAKNNTPIVAAENKIDDIVYLRGKVKLFGAGLLTGANGEFGNPYTGLDNQITIGGGLSYTDHKTAVKDPKTGITPTKGFTGGYAGETLVYGGDIQGVYNDFLVGVALSHDRDLQLNNFKAEVGHYFYSWLFVKGAYSDLANSSSVTAKVPVLYDVHQPTITGSLTAWLSSAVSVTGSYKHFTKERVASGTNNSDTFILSVLAGF